MVCTQNLINLLVELLADNFKYPLLSVLYMYRYRLKKTLINSFTIIPGKPRDRKVQQTTANFNVFC